MKVICEKCTFIGNTVVCNSCSENYESKFIEEEIKPCPFCGQKPYLTKSETDDDDIIIMCSNRCCKVLVKTIEIDRKSAIKTWNTRKGIVENAKEQV